PLYGFGRSERLVGRAVRGRRRQVVLMTKVGLRWDDPWGETLFEHMDVRGHKLPVRRNSRPDSVRKEIERSLERLGVETIDLAQGLLSGSASANRRYALDDWRWMLAGFRPENRRRIAKALGEGIEPIARMHGWTIGQTVLGWVLSQPGITGAIVGARTVEQAE